MKKKNLKAKEPVKVRFKTLRNGNKSIYLDYYQEGVREYEFLKLYIIPERSQTDKQQNEETLKTANAIKAQRVISIQNTGHGFSNSNGKSRLKLVDYLEIQAKKYDESGSKAYARTVRNTICHLVRYKGSNVTMKQVDKPFLLGYIEYLNGGASKYFVGGPKGTERKKLSKAAKALYFNALVTALNRAVKEDVITVNPADKIPAQDKPKESQSTKVYLTLDELKALADTPCKYDDLKRAFLFSCFCGLRLSDVRTLKWSAISNTSDGNKQIETVQQKTGEPVYIPLSDNAIKWLPARANDLVFNLPHVSSIEKWLAQWAKDSKIKKHITYHVSRHTFATLTLTYGADLYTVSKLMGHSNIQTTQIYAKIVDENKRKAVNLIPEL